MNKPIDYPIDSRKSKAGTDVNASDITYAVLRDRVNNKKPVTDEMIRIARSKLETAHINSGTPAASTSKFKLPKLRKPFK